MGGTAPMGYDHSDRKLVVNQEEAQTVQHISTSSSAISNWAASGF